MISKCRRRRAFKIKDQVPDTSPVRDVVLLLGSFHTFMKLLGAKGAFVNGSGLKDIFETIMMKML